MRPDTLGVIGLGAIGGSVAWQAGVAGVPRVLGFSPFPAEGAAAVRAGAVTDLAPSVRHVFERSDLVVLAAPPVQNLALLSAAARFLRPEAMCTDVTAVKVPVIAVAGALGLETRFAGSHPLVAVAQTGFGAAEPARFRGALVYVTPVGSQDAPAREVADFWAAVLEAQPVIADAEVHDAVVAWTSQLPQAVGCAMAHACASDGPRGVTFGSTARAATQPALAPVAAVRDTLLLNRAAVLEVLDRVEVALGGLQGALRDGDPVRLQAWLEAGSAWRRRIEP
jgi:prephenate dehydrogenase